MLYVVCCCYIRTIYCIIDFSFLLVVPYFLLFHIVYWYIIKCNRKIIIYNVVYNPRIEQRVKFYAFYASFFFVLSYFVVFVTACWWLLLLLVGRVLAFCILKDKCVAGKIYLYIFLAFVIPQAKLSLKYSSSSFF